MKPIDYEAILLFLFLENEIIAEHGVGFCVDELLQVFRRVDISELTAIYAELPYSHWE
jgi:hypothetical protein